ncbi:MAG: gluconolactonase [Solirubrobacteraceae bacterium]
MPLSTPLALDQLQTFAEGLDHAEGICQTVEGRIYVGGEAGQIYRIEDDGSPTEILRTDGFVLGLAADGADRLYAADTAHRCVWRIDPVSLQRAVFTDGSPERRLRVPNWGAFGPDGSYYLSDSGTWGGADGLLWRVKPGGETEVWSTATPHFPNGLAVTPDGSRLYVLESYPGALVAIEIEPDGCAGESQELCDLDPAVPDGVAIAQDGSLFISCYRPDAIYHWSAEHGLRLFAEDPRGTILSAPTNLIFTGADRDELVVPNIGRWHLTRMPAGVSGAPLHYPTADQLGG